MYNDLCLEKARNSIEKPPPGVPQGVIVPGSEKDGRSPVYRHWRAGSGELMKTIDPEVRSISKSSSPKYFLCPKSVDVILLGQWNSGKFNVSSYIIG